MGDINGVKASKLGNRLLFTSVCTCTNINKGELPSFFVSDLYEHCVKLTRLFLSNNRPITQFSYLKMSLDVSLIRRTAVLKESKLWNFGRRKPQQHISINFNITKNTTTYLSLLNIPLWYCIVQAGKILWLTLKLALKMIVITVTGAGSNFSLIRTFFVISFV